ASADHLDHASPEDAEALAGAGTAAVLVPGASYQLRGRQAPGPMLWEAGVTVALATDCNPGTSYVESMPFVVSLGVVQMGLTTEQATWAATRGGAISLGYDDRGRLRPGDRADLVVLEAPSHEHLAYRPASDLVAGVVAGGTVVPGGRLLSANDPGGRER
ncbi:MAG: amidohydrolase family protein, partial [Acidimicrobiia bacterium]